jgi:D-3-phosphoglycerate dehydrogenase / 2-oxoglutarate reductase
VSTRILVAGDRFVLNSLLVEALHAEVGEDVEISQHELEWPLTPFRKVAEVDEASGTEEEMVDALAGVEVCVTQMAPLTERILSETPDLRLFCVSRGGPVNANLDAATRHGVAVCSAPGRNAAATAEHTVAMTLATMRRIPQTHADLLGDQWRSDYYSYANVGPELEGSTVGLVGYGAVGSRVARILRGFGAQVVVCDPYVDEAVLGDGAQLDDLEGLLSRSSVVSLHARVSADTTGMIGADQLAAMPPGGILVNCARGALLDYDALCDALDSGHLFGAALDVFPEEPMPAGSRVLQTAGVVMTPHLAGASKQTAAKAARISAGEVGRYLRGEPLAHCANPQVAEGRSDRPSVELDSSS